KREIQIIRFQHAVDAPEDAIGGNKVPPVSASDVPSTSAAARASTLATQAVGSDQLSTGTTSDARGPESSFVATVCNKLEKQVQRSKDYSSSEDEGTDIVLDMAVNAMMESLSSSQSIMQIRCPQCPETAPTVSSLEWDTHRDWHMARQLQERELRHESVAQQLQRAFAHDTSSRAELDAARRALAIIIANKNTHPVVSPVTIKTDSQYAIDALTDPQFSNSPNTPNLDIINDFKRQCQTCGFTVYLSHVSGHGNNSGNKAAHELAHMAAKS
ncbi:hypothetical protein LPJ75_000757, partial [Coemansia sp. RSA 2598]